jgi:dynein heavy chain
LKKKYVELQAKIIRLESGLSTLQSTSEQVADLKMRLAVQEVEMEKKNEAASLLLENVMAESNKVSKEKEKAEEEQKKVAAIKADVEAKHAECKEDLAEAEPLLEQAERALDTLNKSNLTELKSFGSPPEAVINVCACVLVFMANPTPTERDEIIKKHEKAAEKAAAAATAAGEKDKDKAEKGESKFPEPKIPKDRSWKSAKVCIRSLPQILE